MEAIAVRKSRKDRTEGSVKNIGSIGVRSALHKQAVDTHRAIIENFDPDTSETERSCKEATLKTLKKYGLLP
jgi:hypothetical protein